MGAITPNNGFFYERIKMPPERLIAGLLTVVVRHDLHDADEPPDPTTYEKDGNLAYNTTWASNPFTGTGEYPYSLAATYNPDYKHLPSGKLAGTAEAAGSDSTHIKLESGSSSDDDYYNGLYITINDGTGVGQTRLIDDYVGSTLIAQVSQSWTTDPDDDSDYIIHDSRRIPIYSKDGGGSRAISTKTKNLSFGDHETLVFFVSSGCHLEDAYWQVGADQSTGDSSTTIYLEKTYYNDVIPAHDGCQSFVKSHLISRINHSVNAEDHLTPADSLYGNPITKRKYTFATGENDSNNYMHRYVPSGSGKLTQSNEYIFSNGIYHPPRHDESSTTGSISGVSTLLYNTQGKCEAAGHIWDSTYSKCFSTFGLDLTDDSTTGLTGGTEHPTTQHNNFFTPIHSVDIRASHAAPTGTLVNGSSIGQSGTANWYSGYAGITHNTDWWELEIAVNLWGYLDSSDFKTYFRNRVNVMWQPFGETSDLGVTT